MDATATVLPDGKIAANGEVHDTPSGAGVAVLGDRDSVNGWTFWAAETPEGTFALAALRETLLTQKQ